MATAYIETNLGNLESGGFASQLRKLRSVDKRVIVSPNPIGKLRPNDQSSDEMKNNNGINAANGR